MDGIKAAIFDLDGTLFDSCRVWEEIDRRFLGKRNIAVPADYAAAIATMNFDDAAKYTVQRFGLGESPQSVKAEWMKMSHDVYANEVKAKSGAKQLLDMLMDMKIKLGIATSSTSELYMPALKNNGMEHYFSVIVDTYGLRDKSFPDVYLSAAEKLGVKPRECVVFEDIPAAVLSAKNAGFYTIAVFDEHSADKTELLKSIADRYIASFSEIIRAYRA